MSGWMKAAVIAMLVAGQAVAAEIELRPQVRTAGAIVKLGDIAVVHGTPEETRELLALELVPAPAPGRSRSLKIREVQDLLALQGVKLVDHQFSGANSVQISGGGNAATTPALKATRSAREQIESRVQRAIMRHLQEVANERLPWNVSVNLTDEQLALLSVRSGDILAEGGRQPWIGTQQFVLQIGTDKGVQRLPITAVVSVPEMVVVAKRPFRRGEVIQASDVTLELPPSGDNSVALATHLEDVVGRETVRSVATGQPLETSWLRKPIMVRRGEVVTVFARAANLTVRTQARAIEDGGHNDIVTVERLDDRQRFSARVTGVQELEVFVGGVRVADSK
jgi:flagella basal body P-ring formation protein FlgA